MQTFLPYSSFKESLMCLDWKRLNKQRVEARTILNVLSPNYDKKGWKNHPAVLMWKGYEEALKLYYNLSIDIWVDRGYNNTMEKVEIGEVVYPKWFGDDRFHESHRSNLLRKDSTFYGKYGWDVRDDLPYFWPTKEGY
jgi:hypothetical protein